MFSSAKRRAKILTAVAHYIFRKGLAFEHEGAGYQVVEAEIGKQTSKITSKSFER